MTFTVALKIGDEGEQVLAVQRKLKELGWNLDIDGQFGPITRATVQDFQRVNKIGQTGVVGPQTYEALFSGNAVGRKQPDEVVMSRMICIKSADIAIEECKRNYSWTGMDCEAEKYLAPLRGVLGQPFGKFSWCAAFVVWNVMQAGGKVPYVLNDGYTIAYVPAIEDWAKTMGFGVQLGIERLSRKGDWVLFDWEKDGWTDHIGIVISELGKDGYIRTAEGNTSSTNNSNGNTTALRTRHITTIKGFVRFW